MDHAALPEPEAVALLDAHGREATKLFNDKRYAEAETLALRLADLAPNQRIALVVLFEIRKAQKRPKAAEVLAARVAGLPGSQAVKAAAYRRLAQYLIDQGRYAEAMEPTRQALINAPRDVATNQLMGAVMTETKKLYEGERHYRRAIGLQSKEDGPLLANLAWNLKLQGRLEEAAELYARALQITPGNVRGISGYVQVEYVRRGPDRAIALLEDATTRWANDRALRLLRALVDLHAGNPEAVLARLSDPAEKLAAAELSARGRAFDLLDQPADAVRCWAAAKQRHAAQGAAPYHAEAATTRSAAYKAYFTAERVQPLPRASPSSITPVFLIGFPGSGTSLLEQLLAMVLGVAAGDEFFPVSEFVDLVPALLGSDKPYPQALDASLVGNGLDLPGTLRARYEDTQTRLGLARPGIHYITDRAALNAWHLGLIKLIYPDAPIIHVLRHPLDIMLSNFSQDQRLDANCDVSMTALAQHYALTMSMVRHYRGQLTLRYLPVRYEDLVQNTHRTVGRVVDFIGLDKTILPPEQTLRANVACQLHIRPAHDVTRMPVHERSLYRHKRYRAALPEIFAGVQEMLDPWLAELGYDGA